MEGLPLSPSGRRYGALRDAPDHRDLGLGSFPARLVALTPPSVSLGDWLGPVRDQGSLGACSAFAATAMREFLWRRYNHFEKRPRAAKIDAIFSPLFLYYKERELDGSLGSGDCGSYPRTSCRALNEFGVCLETEDVYAPANFQRAPTPTELASALPFQCGAYHRIAAVQDMRLCLASGYGFLVSIGVYSSFESEEAASTGLIPIPNTSGEQLLGGHEVFAVGFDDAVKVPGAGATGAVKFQNSWGAGWGQAGFGWLGYEFLANRELFWDGWMQHLWGPW